MKKDINDKIKKDINDIYVNWCKSCKIRMGNTECVPCTLNTFRHQTKVSKPVLYVKKGKGKK